MVKEELSKGIFNATKWSTLTEFLAKIVIPITNMILARLLTPDAFGVLATITMIISFVDMFTDSGFQKYLVQHEFIHENELEKCTTVAFWTNLMISILLWIIIVIYSEKIAILVGNPGLGYVISIAGISLPLTSFSSIQLALFRRRLDYKSLFTVRIIGAFIPFLITIPLAFYGLGYWSLIIGTISLNLFNAIILTLKSSWKPNFYYNFTLLFDMISFSSWSLAEAIAIWLTTYIGTFIVGSYLDNYYLGLFNTTINTVNGILAIITTATTSVLFSSLSRLQNNEKQFNMVFLNFLGVVSILIFPMGIGIFIYRDLVTDLLLGSQWNEASYFVGIWALVSCITIIFGQYFSEIYRAKGLPKVSFFVQILHLIFLIPILIISAKYGFDTLINARTFIKFQQIIVNLIVVYWLFNISFYSIIKNVYPALVSSIIMGGLCYILRLLNTGYMWSIISIIIAILFYFICLLFFKKIRNDLFDLLIKNNSKIFNRLLESPIINKIFVN